MDVIRENISYRRNRVRLNKAERIRTISLDGIEHTREGLSYHSVEVEY